MMSETRGACLLCGGAAAGTTFPFGTEWGGRRFDYLRCGSCGAAYVDPLPTPAEFERMYDRSSYHDTFYEQVAEEAAASFLPQVKTHEAEIKAFESGRVGSINALA